MGQHSVAPTRISAATRLRIIRAVTAGIEPEPYSFEEDDEGEDAYFDMALGAPGHRLRFQDIVLNAPMLLDVQPLEDDFLIPRNPNAQLLEQFGS